MAWWRWRARPFPAGLLKRWPLTPKPLLWPSPPSPGGGANPQKALRLHDLRTLQRTRNRAALATPVGREGDLRGQKRRPAAEILRAGDVPLSVRAHPYRACPQLHAGRRAGALHARQGFQRAAPDGLGCVRAAGGKRRDRAQGGAEGMDLRQHRRDEEAAALDRAVAGLVTRIRDLRSLLLQASAETVPGFSARRTSRAREAQDQLGPG